MSNMYKKKDNLEDVRYSLEVAKTSAKPKKHWGILSSYPMKYMNGSEWKVYSALSIMSGNKDHCFPSIDTLVDITGLSRRSVLSATSSLEEKGWIEKEHRSYNSVIYYVYYAVDA